MVNVCSSGVPVRCRVVSIKKSQCVKKLDGVVVVICTGACWYDRGGGLSQFFYFFFLGSSAVAVCSNMIVAARGQVKKE